MNIPFNKIIMKLIYALPFSQRLFTYNLVLTMIFINQYFLKLHLPKHVAKISRDKRMFFSLLNTNNELFFYKYMMHSISLVIVTYKKKYFQWIRRMIKWTSWFIKAYSSIHLMWKYFIEYKKILSDKMLSVPSFL